MFAPPSLSVADGSRARQLRQEFSEAVCNDWIKILDLAYRGDVVDAQDCSLLTNALEQMRSQTGALGSEFFHYYFRALERMRAPGRSDAAMAIMTLGNVLLPQLALGNISTRLPVRRDADGLVALPGGNPSGKIRIDQEIVEPEDIGSLREQIAQSVEASWYARVDGWGVRGHTDPIDSEVRKYDERVSRLAGKQAGLFLLDREAAEPIVTGLAAAADLLRDTAPEVAAEIAAVTEYVVPLGGDNFVGGSDIYLYGATFLRLDPRWSPLCFADHLVHEAAHELMHAEHELRPLLLNRDYVGAPSPIRSDPRPLYGTFHATFVFARLASFMDMYLSRHPGDAEGVQRLHRHLLGLLQGLLILDEHGEFSDRGQAEVTAWQGLAADLVRRHGMPSPELYSQLTYDYEPADPKLPIFRP